MMLYTLCKTCKQEINFYAAASDRVRLARKKGEEFKLGCRACHSSDTYHVDEIRAEENKYFQLVGVSIFLVATPILIYLLWDYFFRFAYVYAIAGLASCVLIPWMIYWSINVNEQDKVRAFNRFSLRGLVR